MKDTDVAAAVALWASTFANPIKPREALYVIEAKPEFVAALGRISPRFAGDPNLLDLGLWLALVDNQVYQTPRGTLKLRRIGHHWEVVLVDQAAVAA